MESSKDDLIAILMSDFDSMFPESSRDTLKAMYDRLQLLEISDLELLYKGVSRETV